MRHASRTHMGALFLAAGEIAGNLNSRSPGIASQRCFTSVASCLIKRLQVHFSHSFLLTSKFWISDALDFKIKGCVLLRLQSAESSFFVHPAVVVNS